MKKLLLLLFVFPISIWGQTASDYEIYSVLIKKEFDQFRPQTRYIVIDSIPLPMDRGSILSLLNNEDWKETLEEPVDTIPNSPKYLELDNLLRMTLDNEKPPKDFKLLVRSFDVKVPIKIMGAKEQKKLDNTKNFWEQYDKMYPHNLGLYSFSHISYSGNLAVVSMSYSAGFLAGSGGLIVMIKRKDKWEILLPLIMWIS